MQIDRPVHRLGVTMREGHDSATGERRDMLAQDWARFLHAAVPELAWCPIPNVGTRASTFVSDWKLDAICLSGGDDIGEESARDMTEISLLHHCLAERIPVMGVCRGLQRIWSAKGGALKPIDGHVAAAHVIEFEPNAAGVEGSQRVNSYHRFALDLRCQGQGLAPLAYADDGSLEAVIGLAAPILGMMWHPEREERASPRDVRLVRWLVGCLAPKR